MAKLGRVIRNVAHYGGGSLGNILHHAGLTGKRVRKVSGLNKLHDKFRPKPIASAGSYAYQRGEYYGKTGSIVGRY